MSHIEVITGTVFGNYINIECTSHNSYFSKACLFMGGTYMKYYAAYKKKIKCITAKLNSDV